MSEHTALSDCEGWTCQSCGADNFIPAGFVRTPGSDMRFPREAFCADCPDHEACATAYPCDLVRLVNSPEGT